MSSLRGEETPCDRADVGASPSGLEGVIPVAVFWAGLFILSALGVALGNALAVQPEHVVVLWIPSGLALGALLVSPRRRWPLWLLAIWLSALVMNVAWRRQSGGVAALFGLATVAEAAAGAALARAWAGPHCRFVRMREVAQLLLVSFAVATPLGAFIGAAASTQLLGHPFAPDFRARWLGDALGIVTVTPAILLISRQWRSVPTLGPRRLTELGTILLLLAAATAWIYGGESGSGRTDALLVPIYVWAVARYGALGMTLSLTIVVPLALAYTAQGTGPSGHLAFAHDRAEVVQWILIAQGFTGWLIAALWGHLRESLEEQRRANEHLEEQVHARTAAFEANERRLRVALAASKGFVFEWDISNDQVRRISSDENPAGRVIPPSAVRFQDIVAAVIPEDRVRFERSVREAMAASTEGYGNEYRVRREDGRVVWLLDQGRFERDANGRAVRLIGLSQDITDRKEAEEERQLMLQRLQAALQTPDLIVFNQDRELRYTWVHNASQGDGAGAAIGRTDAEMFKRPEDVEALTRLKQAALDRGQPQRGEVAVEIDGAVRTYDLMVQPQRDAAGAVIGVTCACVDITESKRAEERLAASEQTLRSFYESSPYLMGVVELPPDDSDILHVYDSPATERFFGVSPGSTAGRWAGRDLGVAREQIRLWIGHYRSTQRNDAPVQFDYAEPDASGERWFSVVVACIGPAGKCTRFSYVMEDVSDRKRAEAALREARQALEQHAAALERTVTERTANLRQAVQQMEEFSYSVAHDLRAPLRAMGSYARIIQEDYGERLDGAGRDYLQRIANSGARMDRLIMDLLAYSKVARLPLDHARVSLERLAAEVRQQQRADLEPSPEIVIQQPLPDVFGHEALVAQAMANLVGNAAKFVRPGTTPRILIRAERRADRVRLWVEDNGIGVVPEHQSRIWGMFERGHPASGYEGTGVGLAIVRRALERMGGDAGLESDGKSGSRFWIELPAAD